MNVLAIIPAREGSKGIKNKNIKLLNGHPLLAYSVTAGLNSKIVNTKGFIVFRVIYTYYK